MLISACGSADKNTDAKSGESHLTNESAKTDTTFVEIDAKDLENLNKGDEMKIYADGDSAISFTLNIRRVDEAIKGIRSISAYVDDSETSQAALILREGKLTGRIDLFSRDKRYRLAYDTTSGRHFLQEVHKDSLDILEDSEPLVPEQNP